ncbi:MAG: arginase family protein [Flavobacteriales bacterium]|nr:arginase family protein [Flavobacteriales bacterium]MCX7767696.1 arginase family protein [Flavobacteriales bacterium]MDW8409410.1 arginase family protein [Flavobacteriales bacterium]
MKIFEAFDPIPSRLIPLTAFPERIGAAVRAHTLPDGWENILGQSCDIVLVGFPVSSDGTESEFLGLFREHLYSYFRWEHHLSVCDVGNLRLPWTMESGDEGLSQLWNELLGLGQVIVCVGGHPEALIPAGWALITRGEPVRLTVASAYLDFNVLPHSADEHQAVSFIEAVIQRFQNHLQVLSFIGLQNFLNPPSLWQEIERLLFDLQRLSEFREHPAEAEPLLRLSNMVSFDITALEAAYIPELVGRRPNGFTGVEACRLARYAGLSPTLRWWGLHQIVPEKGITPSVSAQMAAQIVWHLMDGYLSRILEKDPDDSSEYTTYHVPLSGFGHQEILFFRHNITGRWWMKPPLPVSNTGDEHILIPKFIPCSQNDYLTASRGEWPERWWKWLQKITL